MGHLDLEVVVDLEEEQVLRVDDDLRDPRVVELLLEGWLEVEEEERALAEANVPARSECRNQ